MSSYNELIALINGCINRNGVQAITGRVLNGVLRAMVNQLGAGYTMGGVAHPTDDPGTPEAPVCYYASEVGTYTHFGNIQIVPGELALLCFDLTDGWFKETMYEGFESVQATIDGNVGTPAVNVTYVNGVLSFDFSNMKGNTGAAAGFGNISADVDANIGTPSVTVSSSGPDTAKVLAFHFKNLKGETGVTSVVATVDNTSGNPACAVSLNGQELHLDFTGLKGAQGNTGVSADYPIAIINNLTDGGAASALSAEMGKELAQQLSQLDLKVDENFAIAEEKYQLGTDNKYWKATTLQIASSNDYLISGAVAIQVGNVVETNSTFDGTGTVGHMLLDSSALGTSAIVAKIEFTNGKATITQAMWDAGARYISCSYKKADTPNPSLKVSVPKTMADVYMDIERIDGEIDAIEEKFEYPIDASEIYDGETGYWRIDTTPKAYVSATGFVVTKLIPVRVGDVIETNSSIPGTGNAGHIYSTISTSPYPSQWTILGNFALVNGKSEITQALWDAGVRAVSLSFKLADTPNPSVTIHRQAAPGDTEKQVVELNVRTEPIRVVPIDSSNFNVIVPQKNGKYASYHFTKYYKKWDSLSYEDGNGQTQTATNVVSADIWNNDVINDGEGHYLMQGNTNFIFQVSGESKHCGDGHGCEVSLYTQFIADGVEIDPTDAEVSCRTLRMIWKSNVFKTDGSGNTYETNSPALDTDGNPIITAVHLYDAVIDYSGLRANNSLTIKRNGIQFNQCHGAMLEMDFGDFDRVVLNTADKTINAVAGDGTVTSIGGSIDLSTYPNNKANIVEMFGNGVFARQTVLPMRGVDIENFVIHCSFYEDRLKNYFMPVGCNHYSSDAGVSAQTFNSGDVISVVTEREIEIS